MALIWYNNIFFFTSIFCRVILTRMVQCLQRQSPCSSQDPLITLWESSTPDTQSGAVTSVSSLLQLSPPLETSWSVAPASSALLSSTPLLNKSVSTFLSTFGSDNFSKTLIDFRLKTSTLDFGLGLLTWTWIVTIQDNVKMLKVQHSF